MKRFVFDFDGTLCDLYSPWLKACNKWSGKNLTLDDLHAYEDIIENAGLHPSSSIMALRSIDYSACPPIEPVLKVFNDLCERYEVHVVTFPLWDHADHHLRQKKKWLDTHTTGKYASYTVTENKNVAFGSKDDLLIDDGPHFIEKWPGQKLLIKQPWNRNVQHKFYGVKPDELLNELQLFLSESKEF